MTTTPTALNALLVEHIGCYQDAWDRCGVHPTLSWPCPVLGGLETALEDWSDARCASLLQESPAPSLPGDAVMTMMEVLGPTADALVGYRTKLASSGASPEACDVMTVNLQGLIFNALGTVMLNTIREQMR